MQILFLCLLFIGIFGVKGEMFETEVNSSRSEDKQLIVWSGYIHTVAILVALPFLFACFIIYSLLPERTLHMSFLMGYIISVFLHFILVLILKHLESFHPVCDVLAMAFLTTRFSSFVWLNVICVEMWNKFSGVLGRNCSVKKSNFYYFSYGFSLIIVHLVIALLLNQFYPKLAWINRDLNQSKCFVFPKTSALYLVHGPSTLLMAANLILFGLTAWKLVQARQDAKFLRSNREQSVQFRLFLKLLLVMGITWLTNIILFVLQRIFTFQIIPFYVNYFVESFNALHGVVIFFVFFFNSKIRRKLKTRFFGDDLDLQSSRFTLESYVLTKKSYCGYSCPSTS